MAHTNHRSNSASDVTSNARAYAIQRELPHFSPPSSLPHFWKLPRELQHRILLAACGPPTTPRNTRAGRSIDDTATILHLIKTSRFFYVEAMPLLYANVRITRPSTLLSFLNTLHARPSLGQMVKRLHIGPDEALPEHWFPLRDSDCDIQGHFLFRLNLGGGSAKEARSWLGSSSYDYHYDEHEGDDPKANVLLKAINAAAECLDVSLQRQRRDYAGELIESDEYYVRMFELQAAMELYYLELQHHDTKSASRTSGKKKSSQPAASPSDETLPAYPRLRLDTGRSPNRGRKGSQNNKDVIQMTRSRILERISSPGAPMDSFSHPLLFARSGLAWSAASPDGQVHHGDNSSPRSVEQAERIIDVFSGSRAPLPPALIDGSVEIVGREVEDPLNLLSSSSATVGGCLTLARCLLSLTPRLVNLSLTGIFERTLAGERAPCQQPLVSLTLGPAAPDWPVALDLSHATLKGLQRLRICGNILVDSEIAFFVEPAGSLPRLSTLQWSMAGECGGEADLGDPVDIIQQLLGLKTSTTAGAAASSSVTEPQRKRLRAAHDLSSETSGLVNDSDEDRSYHRRSLYIEAHLHPSDVEAVLVAAPTREAALAWQKGERVSGIQHRLKVIRFDEYHDSEDGEPSWVNAKATQSLYDQGKRWWEEE